MSSANTSIRWLCIIFILIFGVKVIETRFIKNEETENILQNSKSGANILDEDVDLENVVEDYYDDLFQYLDKFPSRSPEKLKTNQKEEREKNKKQNFEDYDYMSDMAVAQPKTDDKKFKTFVNDHIHVEKDNETCNDTLGQKEIFKDLPMQEIIRANRESNSEEEFAQRSKEMRIKSIISQVLTFRGGSSKSNETTPYIKHSNALREIYERHMKEKNAEDRLSHTSYTEKEQSFYPSCDVPRNTDEDVWTDLYSMNLLFDLDYPSPQEDSTIMIVTAKLVLYKLPQENYSPSLMETTSNPVRSKSERSDNYGFVPGDDDRQIRVSVYWYTRSLRRNRAKKKLLDSQMLSLRVSKYAEFNIRPAVRTWKDSGKNFGLVVTVEDEDGILLPADQYIQSMNCSKWTANVRAIPSIILDRSHQYTLENTSDSINETLDESKHEEKTKIYPFKTPPYPKIDLCTREVPNSEVKNLAVVKSVKMALEAQLLGLSRGSNDGNYSLPAYLKNEDSKHIFNLSKFDKTISRKSETKSGDMRVGYFQNVPIGSPFASQDKQDLIPVIKKIQEKLEEPEGKKKKEFLDREVEETKEGEREIPRIRHNNRKQREMIHKWSNSNTKARNDFNATDHH